MPMELEKIKRIAFEQMGERSSHPWKEKGNKYYHGERVAKLALTLRKALFPDDDSYDMILTVAAWLHDIENGSENHCERGAVKARKLLEGCCTPDEIDEICAIIAVHDKRWDDKSGFSNALKILQDADLLDHFGTYDVLMNFLYMVSHGCTLAEQIDYMLNLRPIDAEHFRSGLNFELSRIIFDEKERFMKAFCERFAIEASGEILDYDALLKEYRQKEV